MNNLLEKPAHGRAVLVVEPNAQSCEHLLSALSEHNVKVVHTAYEGIRHLHAGLFDLYVLDYWLPDWTGVQLCREIRKVDPHAPVVFYSAAVSGEDRRRALRAGANAYFCKPLDPTAFRSEIAARLACADAESLRAKVEEERHTPRAEQTGRRGWTYERRTCGRVACHRAHGKNQGLSRVHRSGRHAFELRALVAAGSGECAREHAIARKLTSQEQHHGTATRSDERIREELYALLVRRDDLDVSDVSIDVEDGHVVVEGAVPARWMKYRIEDIAADIFGVADVDNRIEVPR